MAKRNGRKVNRRTGADRRSLLEAAARLAIESHDVVTTQAASLTACAAMQREIELLRTPTAPTIQRALAIGRVITHIAALRKTLTQQTVLARALAGDARRLAANIAAEPLEPQS